MTPTEVRRALGYVRVSTYEQGESGAGLEAQRAAIRAECARRGWELVKIHEDVASGSSTNGRPGLRAALAVLEARVRAPRTRAADALVVAKADRLSRSGGDFAALLERARKKHWAFVSLDLGVDTSTPVGEVVATVLVAFASFERRIIAQRTRDALAVKKAQGVRLGRPDWHPAHPELVARVRRLYDAGLSTVAIAEQLDAEGLPTAHGGRRWWPSTVSVLLRRSAREDATSRLRRTASGQ